MKRDRPQEEGTCGFGKILLVDDDAMALELMGDILRGKGFEADTAGSYDEAMACLDRFRYKALVTDMKMPGRSGLDLLKACRRRFPEMPVMLLTAHGSIQSAVEALKEGAFDYLAKPIEMEELVMALKKAIAHEKLKEQNDFLKEEIDRSGEILYATENRELRDIFRMTETLRDIPSTVLLQGESGTGKEVMARYLHKKSSRSGGSFVPINCGAIPEGLIESELFGYEKGAFTDARSRTRGKLEIADGGTLFLDEVNELPLKAQVALLRFMQERELVPLGSNRKVSVDVRIIAATNKDLKGLVREGLFREDLFYRINVLPLSLPPLRRRREDILPLAQWFLELFGRKYNRGDKELSPEFRRMILAHPWPGNIRELRNCMERAVIISPERVLASEALFFHRERRGEAEPDFAEIGIRPLRELEDAYIRWVLQNLEGNRTLTAERLGISLRGLRYKLNNVED